MSLTCNAVGDVLALIKLAIDIAAFLKDCRGAPIECRALCNELRSLERLLALSKPTILALQDERLREIVAERMQIVSAHIEVGLQLIVKFRSAFHTVAATNPAESRRTIVVRWATKAFQSVDWTLRKSADAKACRAVIAQCFEPLIFSLLIAFQADQKAVLGVLQETFATVADEVKAGYETMRDLAAGQEALRTDSHFLKDAFYKHLMVMQCVREDVSNIRAQFADTLTATRLDIADVRTRLEVFCNALSNNFESNTRAVADTVSLESTSTRAMLETFFVTVSDDRLADRTRYTSAQHEITKLNVKTQRELVELKQLMMQHMQKHPSHDVVLHLRFSGVQQLRVASARVQELSPVLLPVVSRAAISDEAIVTVIVLAMTASSRADRIAYGIAAFLLVVARKTCQLYKVPAVVHVIFVEDMFGVALEIPASKCSNSQDFHAALIEKFRGRMGFVLIQRRKYELQLVDALPSVRQASRWTWEHPPKPGAHLLMNTYVRRVNPDFLICPACSAQVISPNQDWRWVVCTFCQTMVQFSCHEGVHGAQTVEPPFEPITEDASSLTSTTSSSRSKSSTSELTETLADDSEEQAALRRCRRIRVIRQTLSMLQGLGVVTKQLTGMKMGFGIPKELPLPMDERFTLEGLKKFDGTDASRPIYLSIKGTVFNVSGKYETYGPGGTYNVFSGKDASRGFGMSSLKPEDAVADWSTLDADDKKVLSDWHGFFTKRYPIVGKVVDLPEAVRHL